MKRTTHPFTPYTDKNETIRTPSRTPSSPPTGTSPLLSCGTPTTGSTVGLPSAQFPFCGTPNGSRGSIEYKYVSPSRNLVTLSTCNAANFDTKIRVYTGNSNICVVGNDDACSVQSTVSFVAEASVEYKVVVQ